MGPVMGEVASVDADTFVVRTVVIPALFTLIGPVIWWPALEDSAYDTTAQESTPHRR